MVESTRQDFYLETWLTSSAHSTMIIDSIILYTMNQRSFIAPATRFVKNTVDDQVKDAAVLARFQKAIRAPQDDYKPEPAEIRSTPERPQSPSALPNNENRNSPYNKVTLLV